MYEKIRDEYVASKLSQARADIADIRGNIEAAKQPTSLGEYTRYLNILKLALMDARKVSVDFSVDDIIKLIEQQYEIIIKDHAKLQDQINEKYERLIDECKEAKLVAAKQNNDVLMEELRANNSKYEMLEFKRQQLIEYSNQIIDLCAAYGITTLDVHIDNTTFSTEELSELYDEYISYMSKTAGRGNPIGWFRENFNDWRFQGVILLVVLFCIFTFVLDFVAIGFFSFIIFNQLKAKEKVKKYTVLMGLVFNIKPMEAGFKSDLPDGLLKEEVDEDEDEDIAELVAAWEKEILDASNSDPEQALTEEKLTIATAYSILQSSLNENKAVIDNELSSLVNMINEMIEKWATEFDEKKSQVQLLGQSVSESFVFNTKFRLGIANDVIEEYHDMGLANITIRRSHDTVLLRQFIQVLLANAFCNVHINKLRVTVYDPNNFGQDVIGFYANEIDNLLKFVHDDLNKVIEGMKEYAMNNNKTMRGDDINVFNEVSEKDGRTSREYKLLLILSQPKTMEEDEALREFMRYSAKMGVFVWLVTDKPFQDTKHFEVPFDGVKNPYRVEAETFTTMVRETLIKAVASNKSPSLAWRDFEGHVIPDSYTWSKFTDNELELHPGYWDGDPSQYKPFTVGNQGNVHVIGVGVSGAGKSVFINHLIACMTKLYSPRDLELWMVDYKGAEFATFLKSDKFPYMLPHIKACLCTSDGDYSGSLYKALRRETERRYDLLMSTGFKDIKSYNQKMRNDGRESEVVPRILVVNDEFQVIFEKAEPNIVEELQKDITYISKVARAAGVHLFFTSQSMKKTISDDILQQFTLRFCLRCDAEVSMSILGNKNSAEIIEPNGYLYVASAGMKEQRKYRTPYITQNDLLEHTKAMYLRAEEQGMLPTRVISYQEKTVHHIDEIDSIYGKANNPGDFNNTIFFGNSMVYRENSAPENYILEAVNNNHIFSCFKDQEDMVLFFRTCLRNINNHTNSPQLFFNSQVADLHYLCELDVVCPEYLQQLSTEKVSFGELLSLFQSMFDKRVELNAKETPAYYFLIGWDKAIGFGIDKDQSSIMAFTKLLQLCAEYNMHFIFINSAVGGIGASVVEACTVRIMGKGEENTSYAVLGNKQGMKNYDMKNGYMFINIGGKVSRAKIYRDGNLRDIKKKEIVF